MRFQISTSDSNKDRYVCVQCIDEDLWEEGGEGEK